MLRRTIKDRLNWIQPNILPKDSSLRLNILLGTIIIVNIVIFIELLGSTVALSVIQGYLAIDATKTEWINNCFMIFLGATVPVAIYTSRKYGFKLMLFVGLSLSFLSMLFTGFASGYYEMLALRAVSGMGGGLIFPISLAIIKRAFRGHAQKKALSIYVGMSLGGGIVFGSIIGGIFGQELAWRSIYFFCFFLTAPCLLLIILFMQETEHYPTTPFDYVSFMCFCLFLISTITLLSQVKAPWNTEGWYSLFTYGCILLLVVSLLAILVRYKHTLYPLFALSLFKNKEFALACVALSFVGVMFFGSNLVMIELLEKIFQYERLKIGYMIAVFGLSFLLSGALPSLLGGKVPRHLFPIVGLSLLAYSSFLNHALTLQSSPKDIIILLVIRAFGVGLSIGPLTAMTLRNIPDDLTGQAAALATIFRQVGGVFGSSAISLIATMRTAFHNARFAEQVNIYSTKFKSYVQSFQLYAMGKTGKDHQTALEGTRDYVISNIQAQSKLASYNDAFFVFGWIFVVLALITLVLAAVSQKETLSETS